MWAPWPIVQERLKQRPARKVPVSDQEAAWIHAKATASAGGRFFDVQVDTIADRSIEEAVKTISRLVDT